MRTLILISCLCLSFADSVFGQNESNGLIGTYESRNNAFDKYSIMTLEEQNRFMYKFGVGACQGEVTGNWRIENKKLVFENDREFLSDSTIFYPNLNLTGWSIKKIGIQPDNQVDTGCLEEKGLHLKTSLIPSHDYAVSIIRLISNQEKYHNRRIQVIGYLNLEFEGDAIYLHKEDYKQSILKNAFWVSFSNDISAEKLKKLNNGYVLIEGVFNMENHGHMGLFAGEIKNIDRIIKWKK